MYSYHTDESMAVTGNDVNAMMQEAPFKIISKQVYMMLANV